MGRTRAIFAGLAILAFVIALNLLVLRQDLFAPAVFIPVAIGVAAALAWIVVSLIAMAGVAEKRTNFSGLTSLISSIVFLGICMVLYAFAKHWDRSWDLTQEGRRELAPQTIQVLQGLTQDVQVLGLFTKTGERETEIARTKTERFLERCRRLSDHLKIDFFDPQKEFARLKSMGLSFADVNGTVVVKCGTRQKTLVLKPPNPQLEERDFTNALINVLRESQPKVAFLSGHGERDLSNPETNGFKTLLNNESYALQTTAIQSASTLTPGQWNLLVINGLGDVSGGDLTPDELKILDGYVAEGGRLMIMVDPQFVVQGPAVRKRLFSWLEERFGIVVGEDLLISPPPVNTRLGEVTLLSDAAAAGQFGKVDVPNVEFRGCFDQTNPITRGFDKMITLRVARSVSLESKLPKNVAGTTILRTLPYTWAEKDLASLYAGKQPTEDPKTEPLGSIGAAVAITVKNPSAASGGSAHDARLVVMGDSDIAKTENIRDGGHLNFLLNCVAWLTQQEDIIAIRPSGKEPAPIRLSDIDEKAITWVSTAGLIQAVLVFGLVMFVVRRRYR